MQRRLYTIIFCLIVFLIVASSVSFYFYLEAKKEMDQKNVQIFSPTEGKEVVLPFEIIGKARVFENVVTVDVSDRKGNILFKSFTMAGSPDVGKFGDFRSQVYSFNKIPEDGEVIVRAYYDSPKDGTPQDIFSVPIKIDLGKHSRLNIFYGNSIKGNLNDCQSVFVVERLTAKTQTPAAQALIMLFSGSFSLEEAEAGYFSSIPAGVHLRAVNIDKKGTAKADFSKELNQGGGSCKVTAIRAQIENTLKQFETVKKVVIAVEGETETALQP